MTGLLYRQGHAVLHGDLGEVNILRGWPAHLHLLSSVSPQLAYDIAMKPSHRLLLE